MLEWVAGYITFWGSISEAIGGLGAVLFWRHLPLFAKILAVQVVCACLTEQAGFLLTKYGKPNAWLYDIYFFLEVIMVSIASFFLTPTPTRKRILQYLIPIFLVAWGVYMFSPRLLSIGTLGLGGYSMIVVLLLSSILEMTVKGYDDRPSLLITFSLLAFFAGVIPMFSFLEYLYQLDPTAGKKLSIIVGSLCIIRYFSAAIAFFLYYRRSKTPALS